MSLDRIAFLIFSPQYCLWQNRDADSRQNEQNVKFLDSAILNLLDLDDEFPQGSSTKLFAHHYRTRKGIDIQFGCKMPVTKKLSDEYLIDTFGTVDVDKYKKFVTDCSYYGIRIEYNPAKVLLNEISGFLQFLKIREPSRIRVSRLDIAIDYAVKIIPQMVLCSGMKKSFIALGSQGVESVYFGARKSRNYIRLYDKAKELKEVHNEEIDGHLWRLELESKESFRIGDSYPDYSKVFSRVQFIDGSQSTGDWVLDLIKQNSMNFGLQSVLNNIPNKNTKSKYKKELIKKLNYNLIESPVDCFNRLFPALFNKLKLQVYNACGFEVVSI